MNVLSDLEKTLLDELYFITSFQQLSMQIQDTAENIRDGIRMLLKKNFICQMHFNETRQDYEQRLDIDWHHVERYAYVITKDGLLAHNK